MVRTGIGALALLLLLQGVAAQPALATLAQSFAAAGPIAVDGHAIAWVLPSRPGGSHLTLDAGALTVYAHEWLVLGPGNGSPPIQPQTHSPAALAAAPWANTGSLQVFATAGLAPPVVHFEAPNLALAADRRACLADPDPAEIQTLPTCYDTRAGGDVAPADIQRVTFSGSFDVKLWGWSGSLETKDGEMALWSGHERRPLGPEATPTLEHWGLLHLRVVNGNLTVDLTQAELGDLVLRDAALQVGGQAAYAPATGPPTVAGPQPYAVSFVDGWVAVTPQGTQALAASSPLPGAAWPWLVAAALLGLGVGAAVVARRFRPRDPVLKALHEGDPIKAARLAAAGGPSRDAEQAVTRAVAYIRAEEFDLAERELCAYALPAADLKFMTACLRARQGRPEEARQLLAECVALQPAYAAEIQLNPDLTRLWEARKSERPEGYI